MLVAAGVGVSKVYSKGAFRKSWLVDIPEGKILKNKIIAYGGDYSNKLDKILETIIKGFTKDKQERFIKRMSLMDDGLTKEYLNNIEKYVNNFEVGGKYNMVLKKSYSGIKWKLVSNKDGYLRKGDGTIIVFLKNEKEPWIDFIYQNGEIKIGKSHSYIGDGNNVDFAGEIYIDDKGKILYWNNNSGHYKPGLDGKNGVIDYFKNNLAIDLNKYNFIAK